MLPRLRSLGKAQTEEDEKLGEEAYMGTQTLRSRTEGYADVQWRNASLGDKVIRPSTALTLTNEAWKAFGKGELVVFSEGRRLEV